ncbi:hypothetical protein PssB301D_03324 [Pseudomonas syringae pv. syringae str. B301D-R]|nr:hypothetical protein PsyrB_05895 [Pseudomonas syringae pv. syringae B301D]EXL30102.1 hypothetical protein PssB301D_03324 [Pseudomonas syringae pv. syringae str. B301D-R]
MTAVIRSRIRADWVSLTIVPTLRVGMQFVTLCVICNSPRQAGLQFELHVFSGPQTEGVAGA